MYTVLGASGHTGAVIANKLLDYGKRVRVLGREAKRLDALVSRGAEPISATTGGA